MRPSITRRTRGVLSFQLESLEGRLLMSVYTVTTTGDGAGVLTQTGAGKFTDTTLRGAINAVNGDNTKDTINFNIPPTDPGLSEGYATIAPVTPLPTIASKQGVTIDGTSEPVYPGNPSRVANPLRIQLNGQNAPDSSNGLTVNGGPVVIKGLAINNWLDGDGIDLVTGGNTIIGNYIGPDTFGLSAVPGAQGYGVFVGAAGDTIGGTSTADRNIISGNKYGIVLATTGSSSTVIQGNYIGTDVSGTVAIPNVYGGIFGTLNGTVIGGTAQGAGNVISGNGIYSLSNPALDTYASGIECGTGTGPQMKVTIQGNDIGTDESGAKPLANTGDGIYFDGAGPPIGLMIGGATSAAGNVISANGGSGFAFSVGGSGARNDTIEGNWIGTDRTHSISLGNGGSGIIWGGTGNQITSNWIANNTQFGVDFSSGNAFVPSNDPILGNSIYSNGELGISLDGTDSPNPTSGANGAQPAPMLDSAVTNGVITSVTYSFYVPAYPGHSYRIEFFSGPSAANGQGKTFLGFQMATATNDGFISGTAPLPAVAVGQVITATATDETKGSPQYQNTSEFSTPEFSPVVTSSLHPIRFPFDRFFRFFPFRR
jgi:hypothetical protein